MLWLVVTILGGLALLGSFFMGPNQIWGGAGLGLVVGLVWGLVVGEGFALILRGAAVGAVVGLAAELLYRLLGRIRARYG